MGKIEGCRARGRWRPETMRGSDKYIRGETLISQMRGAAVWLPRSSGDVEISLSMDEGVCRI